MVNIACQTITFGEDKNTNHMDLVMNEVAKAGYTGIEVGFRRIDPERSGYYADLLKANGLELVALHIGGDFLDPESVKRQMESIPVAIKMAHDLNCSNIFLSGKRAMEKTKEEYVQEAKNYNELGRVLTEEGVSLCYHNHDWEIINDAMGLFTLCENTDPKNMSLVPDVGWITRAGQDPVELLGKLFNRVKHIHFKEFTADNNFIELGKGVVNFKGVYKAMKGNRDYWIVSEQDKSNIGDIESIIENYNFIKSIGV